MVGTYNTWLVLLSIAVAIFASFTALSLSARLSGHGDHSRRSLWLAGAALAMGGGIWSMHFIGMLAFSLPISLSYDVGLSLLSLVIAIAISSFSLAVASAPEADFLCQSVAAVTMGTGISAMHYTGMASINLVPMITYEPRLVAASVLIAVGASFCALWLLSRLDNHPTLTARFGRTVSAFVMGIAISGMHYVGMAASRFDKRSFCIGETNVQSKPLAITTGAVAFAVLSLTIVLLAMDARRNFQRQLAHSRN